MIKFWEKSDILSAQITMQIKVQIKSLKLDQNIGLVHNNALI